MKPDYLVVARPQSIAIAQLVSWVLAPSLLKQCGAGSRRAGGQHEKPDRYFVMELTQAMQQDVAHAKAITARTPAGRWGKVDDIAGAVVFLASSASDFVKGVLLPVDGG